MAAYSAHPGLEILLCSGENLIATLYHIHFNPETHNGFVCLRELHNEVPRDTPLTIVLKGQSKEGEVTQTLSGITLHRKLEFDHLTMFSYEHVTDWVK